MPARRSARTVLLTLLTLLTACGGSPSGEAPPAPADGAPPAPRPAGVVARDLRVPWGVDFLPGGDALVAERDTARILRVSQAGTTPIGRVPGVGPSSEGGLLGLAVSPRFASDHLIYVYLSTRTENRIVRMTYLNGALGVPRPVFTGIPTATFHDGGRITFGPDGMLYAGTGDATRPQLAQDRASPAGKILRMTPEGAPAPGNPFPGSVVYSYGHRNVQGLAFDSRGRLWAVEHGANAWDELNLVVPGGDYGWPVVEGRGRGSAGGQQFRQPAVVWRPAEASPSGMAIVGDVAYVAALRGERLWQVPLSGERAGTPVALFAGEFGRLRTVVPAPDGSLWLTTSNTDGRGAPRDGDDRILRLTTP